MHVICEKTRLQSHLLCAQWYIELDCVIVVVIVS